MITFNGLRFIFSILDKFLPSKVLSTFFGFGFLPTWQHYWTSAGAVVLLYIVLFLRGDFFTTSADTIALMPQTALVAIILGVMLIIVGTLCIFSFQTTKPSATSNDEITIHVAAFQLLVIGFSLPATESISMKMYSYYNFFCVDVLPCATWVVSMAKFLTSAFIPLFFFILILIFLPWPSVTLQLRYNNAMAIMAEGFIYFFYTVVLMYFISFTFFHGNLINVGRSIAGIFATKL